MALKAAFWGLDSTMRIYLGDSAAYLYGAQDDGRLPDDRSFIYSFIIRWLVHPFENLRVLGEWQSLAGLIVAWVLYELLVRRFAVARPLAFVAACLLAIEPAQLYYERMVLAETFGLLAFVLFFVACSAYVQRPRAWRLPVAALFGLAAVSLRLNYLPVVLVVSCALPLVRLVDPSRINRREWLRHAALAVISVAVMHGAYCVWVGQIFKVAPAYLGRAGFMELGLVVPLVTPEHLARVGLPDIAEDLVYPLDDPNARMRHLWSPGGLIFELRQRKLDVDRVARQLSRLAILENPFGVVALGLHTTGDYFRPEEIEHALNNDLGRRAIPYDVVWSLREHWGYDATGLDTKVTVVSRYFEWATPWLVVCLFALLAASVLNAALHWSSPQRGQSALAALFGIGLFLAHLVFTPMALYRYLHPLPFFVMLNAVSVFQAWGRRERGRNEQLDK